MIGDETAVLHVSPHIYPDVLGGIGLTVHETASMLARNGRVTVTSSWARATIEPQKTPYDLVTFSPMWTVLGNPVTPGLLKWIMSNLDQFDIVHLHSHLFLSSNVTALLTAIRSTPTVLSNHGLVSGSYPRSLQLAWTRFALKFLLNHCSKLVCYTEADAAVFLRLGARLNQLAVIPNGVDTDKFAFVERSFSSPLRLVWLGRMAPEKGLDRLLIALHLMDERRRKVSLTLVGTGPLEGTVRGAISQLNLSEVVTIQAPVPYDRVPEVLSKHDALILPSLTEGLPRVVLEAMSSGMPVLCSDLPQLRDVTEDAALRFNPQDAHSMIDSMLLAADDREFLRELSFRGRLLVEKRFSLATCVARLKELYSNLLRGDDTARNVSPESKNQS